jgi:hypothetical protein
MTFPEEVQIFGRMYHISDINPLQGAEGILGLAAYRDGIIYLDQEMDHALSLITLWHEAVHMAQQEILGEVDEAQARWVSIFVHNFLVHNPEISECYYKGLGLESADEN